MYISAEQLHYRQLNEMVRNSDRNVVIDNCAGQRYIGCGLSDKNIVINGVPGNALGAYLDGAQITVNGNAQDSVGDTMNAGKIIIHGNVGDTLGYGMRGGKIYVKGNAGYRTGIHMKEYYDNSVDVPVKPIIIVGGTVGSFLGEYLAGGIIIVLGMDSIDPPVGHFCGSGIHGGKILIRSDRIPDSLSNEVIASRASEHDLNEVMPFLSEYAGIFSLDARSLTDRPIYSLKPNGHNPYHRIYTQN